MICMSATIGESVFADLYLSHRASAHLILIIITACPEGQVNFAGSVIN